MTVYLMGQDTIETNQDGDIVGASGQFIYLIGWTIEEVIRECNAIRIRIRKSHQDTRLPSLQRKKRAFKRYGRVL